MSLSLSAISYFLHMVATVIWLGGMSLLVLVIWPSKIDAPQLQAAEARFRPMANFSLLVLLVTGVFQTGADEHYGGLFDFGDTWGQAMLGKHIAYGAMCLIVAFLQFGLAPALERARLLASQSGAQDDLDALRNRERRLTQANFALGLVVLAFTAVATSV